MAIEQKSVLLFNPWIYDFAAYDFWFKPLGLLYIGALLRRFDYKVGLIDCLDRFHPLLLNYLGQSEASHHDDFSGKFHRDIIEKPACLKHVPRHYARYGMPMDVVKQLLSSLKPPDVILVTSFMTYWYPAVLDAVNMLRHFFPKSKIMLGGIYATLCPEHAWRHIKPDYLIQGEGEVEAIRFIAKLTNGPGADFNYTELDDLPYPAFDLYPNIKSAAILTSRGCPNRCSFCASHQLTSGYRRRSVQYIYNEIRHWQEQFNVQHFAFFDDALLHHSSRFIKPLLRLLLKMNRSLYFYTPNGITPRFMDLELAELFYQANVRNVRLSFETSNEARQQSMSAKVTNAELQAALAHLERAGYARQDIGVYVMMGLPGQTVDEVKQSAMFVHELGARVNMAAFSPIPGTLEYQHAIELGLWHPNKDLLLGNSTLHPVWSQIIGYEKCQELLYWVQELNQQLLKESI